MFITGARYLEAPQGWHATEKHITLPFCLYQLGHFTMSVLQNQLELEHFSTCTALSARCFGIFDSYLLLIALHLGRSDWDSQRTNISVVSWAQRSTYHMFQAWTHPVSMPFGDGKGWEPRIQPFHLSQEIIWRLPFDASSIILVIYSIHAAITRNNARIGCCRYHSAGCVFLSGSPIETRRGDLFGSLSGAPSDWKLFSDLFIQLHRHQCHRFHGKDKTERTLENSDLKV